MSELDKEAIRLGELFAKIHIQIAEITQDWAETIEAGKGYMEAAR